MDSARQASLPFTVSRGLFRFMSIESVMPSNHLICCPLLLPQSLPESESFLMSHFVASGGQGIRASTPVLPVTIQGWFPLGLTGLISLLSKRCSRVFSSTTVWKHQWFGAQPSWWFNSYIHTWLLEKPHWLNETKSNLTNTVTKSR